MNIVNQINLFPFDNLLDLFQLRHHFMGALVIDQQ